MADRVVYTKEAAIAGASVIALSIADSGASPPVVAKLRLFDETLTVDQDTTEAALAAAETTLVGYPVGGYDITDFAAPVFAPLGGVVITSNIINVAYASGTPVTIGGYWIEDASTPTGKDRYCVVFDPKRTLAAVGDGFPIVVQMGYGANAV